MITSGTALVLAVGCGGPQVPVDDPDSEPVVETDPVDDTDSDVDTDSPNSVELSDVYVALTFDVDRRINPDAGVVTDTIDARARFVLPLEPPCWPPEGCPEPQTVDAGPAVYLVGPSNTVRLERAMDPTNGNVSYVGRDLTLADYRFGTTYDLEAPGDPAGLPPFRLVGVQPTVPADFRLVAPDFLAGVTIDRHQDFLYAWTPASTYPEAIFGSSIGSLGRRPWDDGEDAFPASDLIALEAGPGAFAAFSYVEGPYFGLPFSSIQTCQSSSTLSITASVTLE